MSDQPGRIGQEPSPTKSDPTALTTDALQREVAQVTLLFDTKLDGLRQSIADQKELRLAQIANLQEQLNHSERLRLELKADNEKNIDRALTGVEKANEKLEISLTRTLGQMSETFTTAIDGLRRDNDSLKDRISDNRSDITGVVQQKVGAKEDRSGLYATIGAFIGLILLGIAVVGLIAAQSGP